MLHLDADNPKHAFELLHLTLPLQLWRLCDLHHSTSVYRSTVNSDLGAEQTWYVVLNNQGNIFAGSFMQMFSWVVPTNALLVIDAKGRLQKMQNTPLNTCGALMQLQQLDQGTPCDERSVCI